MITFNQSPFPLKNADDVTKLNYYLINKKNYGGGVREHYPSFPFCKFHSNISSWCCKIGPENSLIIWTKCMLMLGHMTVIKTPIYQGNVIALKCL